MTQEEFNNQLHELYSGIADEMKTIQVLSGSLINPENKEKSIVTTNKIADAAASIKRLYAEIESLEAEPIEEEALYNEDETLFSGLLSDDY